MKMAYDLATWHKHKQMQLISQVRFALFPFGKYIIMHLVGGFRAGDTNALRLWSDFFSVALFSFSFRSLHVLNAGQHAPDPTHQLKGMSLCAEA